jgi:hypothetical protein
MEPRFPAELDSFTEPDIGLIPHPRHEEPPHLVSALDLPLHVGEDADD